MPWSAKVGFYEGELSELVLRYSAHFDRIERNWGMIYELVIHLKEKDIYTVRVSPIKSSNPHNILIEVRGTSKTRAKQILSELERALQIPTSKLPSNLEIVFNASELL